jgi:hypothetical protein
LDDLCRIHGEISGLLELTHKQRALTTGGANLKLTALQDAKASEPVEAATVAEG